MNNQSKQEPPVSFRAMQVAETHKAIKVQLVHEGRDITKELWLPKSQILNRIAREYWYYFTIPAWLADRTGIAEALEAENISQEEIAADIAKRLESARGLADSIAKAEKEDPLWDDIPF